jgi:hypothetical protein
LIFINALGVRWRQIDPFGLTPSSQTPDKAGENGGAKQHALLPELAKERMDEMDPTGVAGTQDQSGAGRSR